MAQITVTEVAYVNNDCSGDYYRVLGIKDGRPLEKEVPVDGIDSEPEIIANAIRFFEDSKKARRNDLLGQTM